MPYPQNYLDWSISTVLKWFAAILSLPFFVGAYQGIVQRRVATGLASRGGVPLYGREAVTFGLELLGIAMLCLLAAWSIWYFWERNED
ncbi:MAG: hypothetical protein IH851_00010 [Armatimonadetes bacterium]|nr:hypothetical protein [Armatimonadota bacterium]